MFSLWQHTMLRVIIIYVTAEPSRPAQSPASFLGSKRYLRVSSLFKLLFCSRYRIDMTRPEFLILISPHLISKSFRTTVDRTMPWYLGLPRLTWFFSTPIKLKISSSERCMPLVISSFVAELFISCRMKKSFLLIKNSSMGVMSSAYAKLVALLWLFFLNHMLSWVQSSLIW